MVAKTAEGFTGSRPELEMIGHRRNLIGRVQDHNRPPTTAAGSASLPVLGDIRTMALLAAEMTVVENRSWNSTSLLSRRATRLRKAATLADTTVATVVVWVVEIIAEGMIAATAVEAMIVARPVTAGVVALIEEQATTAVEEAIAGAVEAVRKAVEEEGLPVPDHIRSGANAM